jgi:hypothetical protein
MAACQKNYVWAKQLAGIWQPWIGRTTSGDVLMSGSAYAQVDFGSGPEPSSGAIFVAAFDGWGAHLWHTFNGVLSASDSLVYPTGFAVEPSGYSIIAGVLQGSAVFSVDNGSVNLTSAGGQDIFLAKVDPGGHFTWIKQFGDSSDYQQPTSVAVDHSGNVWMTGIFRGSVNFGGNTLVSKGNIDAFVAKLDPNGSHLWSKSFGTPSSDAPHDIAVDKSDNLILLIGTAGPIDFGGGSIAGGLAIVKFDPSGGHLWSRSTPVAGNANYIVRTDPMGNIVLGGDFTFTLDFGGGPMTTAGGQDIFVSKLDPTGKHLWSRQFGDAQDQAGWALAVDASGSIVITGGISGTASFGGGALTSAGHNDVFVAKLDSAGHHLWSRSYGNFDEQHGTSVIADAAGDVFVAGNFQGGIDFGGGLLTTSNTDGFLARMLTP